MSYKTVSSKFILGKIYKDFKPANSNWTSDAIDWMGDAIQGIGYHIGMTVKITPECEPIQVSCNRACYPCDFESLIGVMYNGKRLPLGGDLSKYGILRNTPLNNPVRFPTDSDIVTLNQLTASLATLEQLYASNPLQTYLDQITAINKKISDLTSALAITSSINIKHFNGDYYSVNPDFIITSFETGNIRLIYNAFTTDENGFPRILDEFNYKKAVEWYIISMMILGGYKHQEIDFKSANEFWEIYRYKAANKGKIPSIDSLDRFTNMWTRAKFSRDLPSEFFAGGESPLEGNLDFTNHRGFIK